MRPSVRLHRLAAILLVVFLLTTVWAAYYLYAETHPTGGAPSSTVVATYAEAGANSFAAALRPSELYNNSTEIYGGNVTLFTAITTWVNVSLLYLLTVNRTASIQVNESFVVTLSTSAWSKTLYTVTNGTIVPATSAVALETRYSVNISAVVALAQTIGTELGYPSVTFALTLQPTYASSIVVGAATEAISSTPLFNLTFSGATVRPGGLDYRANGELAVPAPSSTSSPNAGVAIVALLASAGGLGGSAYVATRRPDEPELAPLGELLDPYAEAVAETGPLPVGATVVPIGRLVDLVKVADTLGKPILRPSVGADLPPELVVLDGGVAYRYRHGEVPSGPTPAPTASGNAPAAAAAGEPEANPVAAVLIERLRNETERLRTAQLEPWLSGVATDLARRSIDRLRNRQYEEATKAIDGLSRLLTDAALVAPERNRARARRRERS